jgi:hypothetical protein
VVGSLSLFLRHDFIHLSFSLPIIFGTYLLTGKARLLITYMKMVSPVLSVSAIIWFGVYLDFQAPDVGGAWLRIFDPNSNFFNLARTVEFTSVIFLILRGVPDGELLPTLRRMGAPHFLATVFANAEAQVSTITDSVLQSYTALRAQGIMTPSRWSALKNLGIIISVTWTASLNIADARRETKWVHNGFYCHQASNLEQVAVSTNRRETAVAIVAAFLFIGMNSGGLELFENVLDSL